MAERKPWSHGRQESRHARGYGKAHVKMREHLLSTVILCEECTRNGRVTAGSHADHVIPKAKGGTDERSNYQLLCASCHAAKSIHDQDKNPRIRRPQIGLDGWPIEE
ncbi:MAG: HNH endonuclease [Porphyrobacter sp.]|nr:HNH endonuclease [Porphyrobacter sp.]